MKKCGRCQSTNTAVAARGQALLIRCHECLNFTITCPEMSCNGRLLDKAPTYKEQKCSECGHETTYLKKPTSQVPLFEEGDDEHMFIGSVVLPPCRLT
jgi:ribosomal protein S27E